MIRILALSVLLASPSLAREPDPTEKTPASPGPGAAAFQVVPRLSGLTYYPCSACHEFMTPNTGIRELDSPHPATLEHGDDRMWCLTCHNLEERDYLTNLLGQKIEFDDAASVCASCHAQRHKDWVLGAHGKRQASWRGQRVIYGCPQCHDPHSPTIKPRAAQAVPPLRKGLEPHRKEDKSYLRVWERNDG
jgi:hypothetical protein